ncbi:MAG TPA: Glu/Leu/Phe/Val dehydrogenase dimerization domain-containing protein [Sphingomicrobium sp.]
MSVFDHPEFASHERVIQVADRATNLRAIIAIHDRTLGPSVGGCRIYPYASEQDALNDVLRLSKGMTYKTALAGLPFGGAKSVIIANPSDKTPALIKAFGRAVNDLGGQYWTGEDVNFGAEDAETLAEVTPYVLGRTKGKVNTGDPSPFTAGGVFSAMKGALKHVCGTDDIAGRRVAIQGLGNVGFNLAKLVTEGGGTVVAADVLEESSKRAADELGATIVSPEAIYDEECDVFAPCAMGATVNDRTVPRLRASIVCGAANNQLQSADVGRLLIQRRIAYVPDYVANAGGILNAFGDFSGQHDVSEVRRKIDAIGITVERILEASKREHRPANDIADEMADAVLAGARGQ